MLIPELNEVTFKGISGLLADSLPDKFGTRIIDEYLVKQGRFAESLTAVERLCYVGNRGMGALEIGAKNSIREGAVFL